MLQSNNGIGFIEVLLGLGAFTSAFSVLAMVFLGYSVFEPAGPYLLIFPLVGVLTIFASMFYAFRNQPLGARELGWVLILGCAGFLVLPIFWYLRVLNRDRAKAT